MPVEVECETGGEATLNRRNLLKLLPVAALAPVATKIGSTEVQAHELKPGKKYVFVLRGNVEADNLQDCQKFARDNYGIDAFWLASPEAEVEIYELT